MLANPSIRGDDAHSVIDVKTGDVLNKPKHPLIIEDHCWIAADTKITKNAHIHANSIVAANAVVTKDYLEENVVIAGNPARIVKRGVTWNPSNCYVMNKNRE